MGAVGISCMLCSVWHCSSARCELSRKLRGFKNQCDSLLKLISKPDLVLLGGSRSKTSSEEHVQIRRYLLYRSLELENEMTNKIKLGR